tara:strand:- start:67 stop:462 length:396 start_codon:yes stop_codon:yes gene_type:complete
LKRRIERGKVSVDKARRPSELRAAETRGEKVRKITRTADGKIIIDGKKVPAYVMPKTRKEFLLDVEIGKMLAYRADALTMAQIRFKFGVTRKKISARAELLRKLVDAGQAEWIKNLLRQAGEEVRFSGGEE